MSEFTSRNRGAVPFADRRPPTDAQRFHDYRRGWVHGAGFRPREEFDERGPDYDRGWNDGRAAFGAAMRSERKTLGCDDALMVHPAGDPAAAPTDGGVAWGRLRRCDSCGAEQAEWQERDAERCPNHANPLGSCDGRLE